MEGEDTRDPDTQVLHLDPHQATEGRRQEAGEPREGGGKTPEEGEMTRGTRTGTPDAQGRDRRQEAAELDIELDLNQLDL